MGPAGRAAALRAVAGALDAQAAALAAVADTETALGSTRLTGEVARTTGQLRMFADVLEDGGYLDVITEPARPGRARAAPDGPPRRPGRGLLGVELPVRVLRGGRRHRVRAGGGLPGGGQGPRGHPQTSAETARIVTGALAGAGAPDGMFAVIYGFPAGVRLLRHPAITAAGFTGSARGGLALQQICAQRDVPIPFYGELGSANPAVVLPGAATARAAETATGYAGSLTLGAGQFCTNPGLLFIPDDEGLRTAIAGAVEASTGAPMLSERIHSSYDAAAAGLAGHRAVTPLGTGHPGEGPWAATPQVFLTSLDEFAAGLPELAGERFGPAGLVITYPSVDALLPVLARLGGNLSGSIHADPGSAGDLSAAGPVADVFTRTVGRVIWNGWPTGVAVTWAQHHGGPFPATTSPHYTSVGATAIRRWLIPVTYQDFPDELLPAALRG